MRMEIFYFDGCPTYKTAEKTLREVLAEEGIEAEVESVRVGSDQDAQQLRFPGSPTIRIDGRDLFPAPEREDWRLGCRVYPTPGGLRGSPTKEMFREALAARNLVQSVPVSMGNTVSSREAEERHDGGEQGHSKKGLRDYLHGGLRPGGGDRRCFRPR